MCVAALKARSSFCVGQKPRIGQWVTFRKESETPRRGGRVPIRWSEDWSPPCKVISIKKPDVSLQSWGSLSMFSKELSEVCCLYSAMEPHQEIQRMGMIPWQTATGAPIREREEGTPIQVLQMRDADLAALQPMLIGTRMEERRSPMRDVGLEAVRAATAFTL